MSMPSVAQPQPLLPEPAVLSRFFPLLSSGFFALLALMLFGNLLFTHKDTVISSPGLDLSTAAVPLFTFVFRELRAGHLPLWNPCLFCGQPCLADPASAMFYPPHWLGVVL